MTAWTRPLPAFSPATSLAMRFGEAAREWWRAHWARKHKQATVLLLRSLDDRALKDIGIDRSEIVSVVYGTANDRRVRYVSPPV